MSSGVHRAAGVRISALGLYLIAGSIQAALAPAFASAQSAGALGNGLPAAAVARGGTMAAEQGSLLEAAEGNPAGLAALPRPTVEVSGLALLAHGTFTNSVDSNGTLRAFSGAMPYAAFGAPIGSSRWKAALAVTPDLLMRADWRYADPPGTAGVTYGVQKNESEIVALRTSANLARSVGSKWTFGGTVGIVYNSNKLNAPYIFQQQPALKGLKVLINLNSSGFGWNGSAGAQYQPSSRVRLGLAWKSVTYVQSHGDLSGTASALFNALGIAADPTFHYAAEVDNRLPQSAVAGLRWQASHRATLSFEGGWTGWAGAFENLPVKLKGGTNVVVNSVAGSPNIEDHIALHWRDQGSFRVGVEVPARQSWTARAGYAFASNPVPSATLTPLTAAILSNSIAAGIGYNPESSSGSRSSTSRFPGFAAASPWSPSSWRWDLAYQAQLPASQSVGLSGLQAGEYSNSRVHVRTQSLILSARLNF